MDKIRKNIKINKWYGISASAWFLAFIGYAVAGKYGDVSAADTATSTVYEALGALGAFIAVVICCVAIAKVKNWGKLFPTFFFLLSLLTFFLAYFAYSWSYASF